MEVDILENTSSENCDNSHENFKSDYLCQICGNHASGFHYGVLTCNACTSFFRRAIFRKKPYLCSLNDGCPVSVEQKSICQACRFSKCIKLGMKYEINKDSKRAPKSYADNALMTIVGSEMVLRSTQTINLVYLQDSYNISRQYSEYGVEIPYADFHVIQNSFPTYVLAYHNAMQVQVMTMVEWMKRIPGFKDLVVDDQITLIRASARRHAFLRFAYNTAVKYSSGQEITEILVRDNVKIPANPELRLRIQSYGNDEMDHETSNSVARDMVALTKCLREWRITEEEMLCFEALVILNPNTKGLRYREKVLQLRKNIQTLILAENTRNSSFLYRIMDLHLLLSTFDDVSYRSAKTLGENSFFATLRKVARLLEDLVWFSELSLNLKQLTNHCSQ